MVEDMQWKSYVAWSTSQACRKLWYGFGWYRATICTWKEFERQEYGPKDWSNLLFAHKDAFLWTTSVCNTFNFFRIMHKSAPKIINLVIEVTNALTERTNARNFFMSIGKLSNTPNILNIFSAICNNTKIITIYLLSIHNSIIHHT